MATTLGVFGQQRHAGEGFRAIGAGVFLNVGMGLQMSSEVGTIGECAMTMLTAEWLLAGVGADMTLQQPWPGESFAADIAFAGQSMGTNMHFQGSQRNVGLITIFAAKGFLHLISLSGRTMELLMFGQTRESGIGLLTIRALIARRTTLFLFNGCGCSWR